MYWAFVEVCHHAPLVLAGLLLLLPRRFPAEYTVLALALLMSWVADTYISLAGDPVVVTYALPLAQLGLMYVFLLNRVHWVLGLLAFALVVSGLAVEFRVPEAPVWLFGGLGIAGLCMNRIDSRVVRAAAVTYFGIGSIWYYAMVTMLSFPCWVGYQITRLVAIAMLGVGMTRLQRA
jgi:hypothetical protein